MRWWNSLGLRDRFKGTHVRTSSSVPIAARSHVEGKRCPITSKSNLFFSVRCRSPQHITKCQCRCLCPGTHKVSTKRFHSEQHHRVVSRPKRTRSAGPLGGHKLLFRCDK